MHATLVPRDPARTTKLALWSSLDDCRELDDIVRLTIPIDDEVRSVDVACRLVDIQECLDELLTVNVDDSTTSASLRCWAAIARCAVRAIARGRLQPGISESGFDEWHVSPLDQEDSNLVAALAGWIPPTAHCLNISGPADLRILDPLTAVSAMYDAIADTLPRTAAALSISRQPAWAGRDVTDVSFLTGHLNDQTASPNIIVGLRVGLPDETDDVFRVDLQLRSSKDRDLVADAAQLWTGTAPDFDEGAESELLLALRRGARVWPPLEALLDQAEPTSIELNDDDAMALISAHSVDLGAAGIEVLIPESMVRTVRSKATVNTAPSSDGRSSFDLATVCELTWSATIDGDPVSVEELSMLAASQRPLIRMRGGWVIVEPEVIERIGRSDRIGATDALSAALGGELVVDGKALEVSVDSPIRRFAQRIAEAATPHEVAEPDGLEATLRPYQRRGVAWLSEMVELGFGGVLADDMGLGKTVQLIAVHLMRSRSSASPTLVVCPAGLVGNWQRELERFAPSVEVHRYHGASRSLKNVESGDIVLTTYGIMRRDAELLAETHWDLVVADEAQFVKNPNSATARSLRRIPAAARVAMTGTPVENRLTELWALLDWTTPGLLGNLDYFRRTVSVPIERDRDPTATEHFARLVSPFVLRRRKDDAEVAPDLPPKTETDHPVRLTSEQAGLYRAAVEELLESVEEAEGIQRRGLVLKLLTALKQICNHPAQYLRQSGPLSARSAKLEAFEDLVGAITDAGDSTLVFTQYVQMGELLMARLGELGVAAEFLHGSVPLQRRIEMVDRFQDGAFPVFVVSLKAGGTGLNLTRATHVIHYDRWWNPAVENQASDRVWRIGQDRPVQVHKLISEGTIEDRIAVILSAKAELAEAVVGSGESWITEMSNPELADLVRLSSESF